VGSQDLQQARYDQLVRRVGALYGGGSKVVEVLPEVFPVLELEGTTPELLALSGWRLAWQQIQQNGVVGQTSALQLANPVGSNVVAAVTQIIFTMLTQPADSIQMQITNTLFTSASIRGLFRDARFGGNRSTALELRSDPNIATGAGLRLEALLDVPVTVRDDNGLVVLTPGTAFQVGTTGNNIDLSVNFFWRERIAQESEINFP